MKKILIALMISFGLLPVAASAQSLPRLEVEFAPDPLFSEMDVKPGDETGERTAVVTNNTDEDQEVIISLVNVTDPISFGGVITLRIMQGETVVFEGELSDLYNVEVILSTLPAGASTTYTFETSISSDVGNDYQNAETDFDVMIGFSGEDTEEDTGGGISGGGYPNDRTDTGNGQDEEDSDFIAVLGQMQEALLDLLPQVTAAGGGIVLDGDTGTDEGAGATTTATEFDDEDAALVDSQLAGLFGLPDEWSDWLWWAVLLAILIILGYGAWVYYQRRRGGGM